MINIGETLRKKRESKKLTLESVYQATRIPPHILSHLEKEEFDKLAGVLYVKGFLKKYAEFLGLNSSEIVNTYLSSLSQTEPPSVTPVASSKEVFSIFKNKGIIRKIIVGLVLVIAVFLLFKTISFSKKISAMRKEKKISLKEKPAESLFIPKKEALILKIKAKKDTWIQLKADGKIVFQHILKTGTEDSWNAKENFELWVGEAKNLTLFLNEKPLEIKGEGVQKGILIDHAGLHRE
ncbi:MAG: DUF4115 domain-containing protein [Candidatus Omnitrophica bacterium]|nr:DUF4115 domain-containing protein [Candidatus Omnitrophota bacterium]